MTTTGGRARRSADDVLFGATAAVGVVLTVTVAALPAGWRAFRAPAVNVALETASAVVALLVAFLVYGRFSRSGRAQELLLVLGLSVVGIANLALTALPSAGAAAAVVTRWAALPVRLLGGLILCAAALTPPTVLWARRVSRVAAGTVMAAIGVVGALGALWSQRLSASVASPPQRLDVGVYQLSADWSVLTAQASGAVLFGVAALALLRQLRRTGQDELLRWMAAGCVLAALARVHYVLFPSLYSGFVYTGDFLRLGFYVYLLIGASREIESYWRSHSHSRVLADRRRIARELHDGVIHELGYIRAESHVIPSATSRELIIGACDRALDEARVAVQSLGHPSDEPLGFMLHRAAEELAARYQVGLQVDLDDSVVAPPDQAHALVRITREAVSNAVRHGNATRLFVRLGSDDDGRCLSIRDDGTGFDVAAAVAKKTGYGLISMRERAEVLPGSLDIRSSPGTGSVVTARW
jgi:signal transduction histidine kinase